MLYIVLRYNVFIMVIILYVCVRVLKDNDP